MKQAADRQRLLQGVVNLDRLLGLQHVDGDAARRQQIEGLRADRFKQRLNPCCLGSISLYRLGRPRVSNVDKQTGYEYIGISENEMEPRNGLFGTQKEPARQSR